MIVSVFVRTSFVGFHRWKEAPEEVVYLRHFHRHKFNVELHKEVTKLDREIEYHTLLKELNRYIKENLEGRYFEYSCETIAVALLRIFKAKMVKVDEDGENGSVAVMEIPEDWKLKSELTEEDIAKYRKIAPVEEKPDKQISRKKPFVGIEAEGPFRGKETIFIPGGTHPDTIEWCLKKISNWYDHRVYYGAGDDRRFRPETLQRILNNWPSSMVTVEVNSLDDIPVECRRDKLTIVSMSIADVYQCYNKQIRNGVITWYSPHGTDYSCPINDPLFAQDKEI